MTENEVVKESMVNALLELMKNNDMESITITQITKKAGVSRMSFYRNFSSKESILSYQTDIVFRELIEKLPNNKEVHIYEYSKMFFSFLRANELLLKNLTKANLFVIFSEVFTKHFISLFIDKFELLTNDEYVVYEIVYRVGGLANIILTWVQQGFIETNEEMANVFKYLYEL